MKAQKMMLITVLCGALILFGMTGSGWAVPVTGPWSYASPTDSILGYESLETANEAAELTFANNVLGALGLGTTSLSNGTGEKVNNPGGGNATDIIYNPGFSWDYAVVKVDGPNDFSYLFMDSNSVLPLLLLNGDDILTTPAAGTEPYNMGIPALGISHITWFGGTTQVPEPSTILLLGCGLFGLWGARRKLKK